MRIGLSMMRKNNSKLIINELQKTNKKLSKIFGNIEKFSDLCTIRVEGIPLPQFKTKKTKVMNKFQFNYTINGVSKSVKVTAEFQKSHYDGVDVVIENCLYGKNYDVRFDGIHNLDGVFLNTIEHKCEVLEQYLPSMFYEDFPFECGPTQKEDIRKFNEKFDNPKWEVIHIS